MELWIRSQDGEALTKVNMGLMYWKDINNRDCIVNKDNATGYSILGAYKTKERALEVVDEIQRLLKPRIMMKYNNDCTMSVSSIEEQPATYVYEMPKE